MKRITSIVEMKEHSRNLRARGAVIGFVPTMGALHEGHLSLLKVAREHCGYVIASIFVNQTQFGANEDFDKYPRMFENDCALAQNADCDCVFAPGASEMYGENFNTYVNVENITQGLCGASRPTHFRGVATVVLKLFNIVTPNVAVFGAKDAQQVIVIKRMVEDLNLSVQIVTAPTIRESDGLAMSSRNAYLTPAERADAPLIYKSLVAAKTMYDEGERNSATIKNRIVSIMTGAQTIKTEYAEIVDVVTVKPLAEIKDSALVAVACRTAQSNTRLIDNINLIKE